MRGGEERNHTKRNVKSLLLPNNVNTLLLLNKFWMNQIVALPASPLLPFLNDSPMPCQRDEKQLKWKWNIFHRWINDFEWLYICLTSSRLDLLICRLTFKFWSCRVLQLGLHTQFQRKKGFQMSDNILWSIVSSALAYSHSCGKLQRC